MKVPQEQSVVESHFKGVQTTPPVAADPPGEPPLTIGRLARLSQAWFADLPSSAQVDILGRGRRRVLARQQALYLQGDEADGLYCVLSGSIRVCRALSDGREVVLDLHGPGCWLGEDSALDKLPRLHDAIAHEVCAVLHIQQDDVEAMLTEYPEFSRGLLRRQSHRLRIQLLASEGYVAQSLEQRLACRLLILSSAYGVGTERGRAISLPLSQELLGRLVGATRQSVNRILKRWERTGTVDQRYGQILVTDPSRLEALADNTTREKDLPVSSADVLYRPGRHQRAAGARLSTWSD
jgi:CRP/FNR family cyclic AMP-dependent transcriptional regulator